MDKVLIEIVCPGIGKSYEFWVPKSMRVGKLIQKLQEDIRMYEAHEELFTLGDMVLYLCDQMALPDENLLVTEAGICSGMKLLLL